MHDPDITATATNGCEVALHDLEQVLCESTLKA